MKIGKYTKLKSNKYSVVIDDITVKLYDDVIVKYELLRLKEIDEKLFKEITEYNDRYNNPNVLCFGYPFYIIFE